MVQFSLEFHSGFAVGGLTLEEYVVTPSFGRELRKDDREHVALGEWNRCLYLLQLVVGRKQISDDQWKDLGVSPEVVPKSSV